MREVIVLLAIIAVIAIVWIIWSLRTPGAQTAVQRKIDEFRGMQAKVGASDRAGLTSAATLPAPRSPNGGFLQRATDIVAGMKDEQATDQLEEKTAELTQARQDAERAAARLSDRGEAALAIQTAAAAHGGVLPGDGTRDCPPAYPIKGNAQSLLFHQPGSATYLATIAEYCFASVASAEAAGFSLPMREKTAELIQARQDAERVAASFSSQSKEALAIQIAAAAHGGVLPGDGTHDCPSTYPIKGNQSSMLYHEPGTPTYLATIPEFCFSSAESAEAAGFSATEH